MARSRVYNDTFIQNLLKDILVPLMSHRDTSKSFGDYTTIINKINDNIETLKLPDKHKRTYQSNMSYPIFVLVPNTDYDEPHLPFKDSVTVNIQFETVDGNHEYEVVIPVGYDTTASSLPICTHSSKLSKDVLSTVTVSRCSVMDEDGDITQAYMIRTPEVELNTLMYGVEGTIQIYSNNRSVRHLKILRNSTEASITYDATIALGSVAYFEPVEDMSKVVYSNSIRWIESNTATEYNYLLGTSQSDKETLYHIRQDEGNELEGRYSFSSLNEFKSRIGIISSLYNHDLSKVVIEFDEGVDDISGAFMDTDITSTPHSILGPNVRRANSLFKEVTSLTVVQQSTLLGYLTNLEEADDMFNGCTSLAQNITTDIIESLNKLWTIRRFLFGCTAQTIADVNFVTLYGSTTDPILGIQELWRDGAQFFEGCTSITNLSAIPDYWKSINHNIPMHKVEGFRQYHLNRFLLENANELESFTFDFGYEDPVGTITPTVQVMTEFFMNADVVTLPIIKTKTNIIADKICFGTNNLTTVREGFLADAPFETINDGFRQSGITSIPTDFIMNNTVCYSYDRCFMDNPQLIGGTPVNADGFKMWELEGKPGYPATISGLDCFINTNVDELEDIPSTWGGNGA